jgi:dienelactone hydrolase
MGSCQSNTAAAADKGKVYKEEALEAGEHNTGPFPPTLYKASKLFAPTNPKGDGPHPAVILVHGSVFESDLLADVVAGLTVGATGYHFEWDQMAYLAREVAKQGVICFMIGMPSNDAEVMLADYPDLSEEKKKAISAAGKIGNGWSGRYYAKALDAAIDHLIALSPQKLGLQVDPGRIGLVGHSMGGGGVLCAAGTDCATRIKAVVALNPSLLQASEPVENMDKAKQFATGKNFSGEYGEGTVGFLADIKAATLIFGSRSEWNVPLLGFGPANQWPTYDCQFKQVGAAEKELFVDNLVDEKATNCFRGHAWLLHPKIISEYGDGAPLRAILSFVRRKLIGSAEEPMEKPAIAHSWEVLPGK